MQYTATYFDGKSARPQLVRVLLFNEQLNVYEADTDNLLQSYPVSGCALAATTGNDRKVWLTEERTACLVMDPTDTTTSSLIIHTLQNRKSWFGRLFKINIAALLGILLLLMACIYLLFTEAVPRIGLYLISVQREEQLGKAFMNGVVNDKDIDSAASHVAQDFANRLHLSNNYRIRVYVVKQREVNAFALPGGIIVINTGIISSMKSYEELGALLGHEVTHINDRHSLRSMMRQLSFSAFIGIITGDASGISGALISNAAALQSLSYSRSLEAAADKKGMQLLLDNQINPSGMTELMKHLQTSGHSLPVEFLSSHPLTRHRITEANEFIKQHKNAAYTTHPDLIQLWNQLKAKYP